MSQGAKHRIKVIEGNSGKLVVAVCHMSHASRWPLRAGIQPEREIEGEREREERE